MTATQNGRYSPRRSGENGENGVSPNKAVCGPVEPQDSIQSNLSATHRDQLRAARAALGARLSDLFRFRMSALANPPGWDELSAYAQRGAWTKDGKSFVRGLGVLYLNTICFAAVFKARVTEWVMSRPARLLVVIGLAELVLRGTGGFGDTIADAIRTYFHALAWIFGI